METSPLLGDDEEIQKCGFLSMLQIKILSHKRILLVLAISVVVGVTDLVHFQSSFHHAQILAAFLGVVSSLIITTTPISAITLTAMLYLLITQSLYCKTMYGGWIPCYQCQGQEHYCDPYKSGLDSALSGFSDPLAWLVLAAFHMGEAIQTSKLGRRIALFFLVHLGQSAHGLAYAIFFAELITGPFVPSNSARGGGIIMPVVSSMIQVLEESMLPDSHGTAQFLVLCGFHYNLLVSSMFLTATIGNPFIIEEAKRAFGIDFGFLDWTLGAFIPGILCAGLLPILFMWTGHVNYQSEPVMQKVRMEYREMGLVSSKEKRVIVVFLICLSLWILGQWLNLPETLAAMVGIWLLWMLQILSWKDIIHNANAWDSFFWLSLMIMLSKQLAMTGLPTAMGVTVADWVSVLKYPIFMMMALSCIYFVSMYLFSSLTGHLLSLAPPFFVAARALNCPPFATTAFIGYFSSLCGCLTNYSSGSSVIYFGILEKEIYHFRPRKNVSISLV